ncbi:hypothetical protein ACWDYH_28365 [Nocardia goodfellowii]
MPLSPGVVHGQRWSRVAAICLVLDNGDPMLGPADTVEQRESVSMAMLTVMERLWPNERVV